MLTNNNILQYTRKYKKYRDKINKFNRIIGGEAWTSRENLYTIITHGKIIPEKFTVPKGVTFIVFESTGNTIY